MLINISLKRLLLFSSQQIKNNGMSSSSNVNSGPLGGNSSPSNMNISASSNTPLPNQLGSKLSHNLKL